MARFTIDYGTGHTREISASSPELAEAFAASERAILHNPDVRVLPPSPVDDLVDTALCDLVGDFESREAFLELHYAAEQDPVR